MEPTFGQKLVNLIETYCDARDDFIECSRERRDSPNEETMDAMNNAYDRFVFAKKRLADAVDAMFTIR